MSKHGAGATGGRAFGGGTSTGIFGCSSPGAAYTSGSIQSRINGYLNPACFSPTPVVANTGTSPTLVSNSLAPTGYGNTPRNAFRGPTQQNWDFALAKHIKLYERQALDLRTDFFNIFNHPSFRQPSTVSIGSPTFGQITSTVNPARLIQLGAQYSF